MIRKKNSFFTFIFSLIPGAGQMYMGFMKRGLSLMSSFVMIIFFSVWLNAGPIMFIGLIAWFYSFFDTHNLRSTPNEEFYNLKDEYILFPEFLKNKAHLEIQKRYRNIIAIALIVIGFTILWNNVYYIFGSIMPYYIREMLYSFGRYIPQLIIGISIILFGFYLIRGKKQELYHEEMQPRITELINNENTGDIDGVDMNKEDISSDEGGNVE